MICVVDMFAGFAASLRRARRRAAIAEVGAAAGLCRAGPGRGRPEPAPVVPGPAPRAPAPVTRLEPVKVEPAMPAATMPVVKVDPVQKIEP